MICTIRGRVYSAAFPPLFPFLWKTTGLSPRGMSALNYFIFILSMALLFAYLQSKAPIKDNSKWPFFIALCISMLAFVALVSYVGNVFQFKFLGMLLLMGYTFFAINHKRLNRQFRVVAFCALTLMSTVWNTYPLNMMFCNGWTFT